MRLTSLIVLLALMVFPVFARNSVRESDASGEPITFSGLFPKTFHTLRTEIIGAAELMYSPLISFRLTVDR